MYCEKYSAKISEKTCIARQKNASGKGGWGRASVDPGCVDCEQGKQILKGNKGEDAMTIRACNVCGQDKVIDDFPKDKRSIGGHKWVCKDCFNAQAVEKRKSKKEEKATEKKESSRDEMSLAPAAKETKSLYLMIDFAEHPELYQGVIAIAQEEFRTPEAQILYLLSTMRMAGSTLPREYKNG